MEGTISTFFKAIETMDIVRFSIFMVALIAAMWIYFVKRKGSKDDSNTKNKDRDITEIRKLLNRDNTKITRLEEDNEELFRTLGKQADMITEMNKGLSELSGMIKVILNMKS